MPSLYHNSESARAIEAVNPHCKLLPNNKFQQKKSLHNERFGELVNPVYTSIKVYCNLIGSYFLQMVTCSMIFGEKKPLNGFS